MPKDQSMFVRRVNGKAKRLRRALVQELNEKVRLGQCLEWISTAFGFRTYRDLLSQYHAKTFVFDELVSQAKLKARLSTQVQSLAFDFDLADAVARRIVEEVRPTAARWRIVEGEGQDPDER